MLLVAQWIIYAGAAALGVAAGIATRHFWEKIKAWASRVVGYILDAINNAIEVASKAIISIVKEGKRYYKLAKVYVMGIHTGETKIESKQEQISTHEIPPSILKELQEKREYKLMKSKK
ncbi:MAG: hypothetical protein F6K39_20395 [Okeania sp. SIO3B3]|nr:hypothetical protein [Okeania sp. SIO3B3]